MAKVYPAFLFCLIMLFCNCKKDDDNGCDSIKTVGSNYKGYVPYKLGKQLIFKTLSGEEDTLVVKTYRSDYFNFSASGCTLQESIHCDISIGTKDTTDLHKDLAINFYDNTIFYNALIIDVDDGEFISSTFYGSFNAHIESLPEIELNGQTYTDVLLAACPNPPDCTYIDSVCFVKNLGLVYYTINGVGRVKK